jgi:hypothetical protein
MNANFNGRPASQEEVVLFTMMGQALLNIQVMEECLSMAITLKADVGCPRKVSKAEADELLKKRRKLTLGQAIDAALENNLYTEDLQIVLKAFRDERNWLVHKSIDDFYAPTEKDKLLQRMKSIAVDAHKIQREIEDDLINYAESNGLDMSNVRQAITKWQHGSK